MSYPLRVVKQELKLGIDAVKPDPGDILIVHPKNQNEKFSQEFADWLCNTMPEILPPGVKALVIATDSTTVEKLAPEVPNLMPGNPIEAYEMGWHAAIEALEKFYADAEEWNVGEQFGNK